MILAQFFDFRIFETFGNLEIDFHLFSVSTISEHLSRLFIKHIFQA